MTPDTKTTWYLVQIKPNSLRVAERNLVRQGFEVFAPLTAETKRSRSGFVERTTLLFPGYMFVAVTPETKSWSTVNSTNGVSRVVKTADRPSPVPGELIDQLRARCDLDGLLKPLETLEPGTNVLVSTGPFAEFIGQVEQMAPDQRVWVLIDMMGRTTRVALPRDGLTST
ncbi:transcription termination/antitermination protein NusG [Maritimibacter sp. DP1N21-5]|uniref:transcription termination/antitermination protein NusG n=1 Tax=Maritimibacter sp. DP1N21-5 TaxID=2836867 RepID=UPI001C47FB84|nr:transcriptional activator RfaH [Maritimibacter sp. DP1N21-5]MBV7410720.1 transcriptional activator RfaH [Maritimibacter sp. DP1N21-5]